MQGTLTMPINHKPPYERSAWKQDDGKFNPTVAGVALAKGLKYLQKQLGWSGIKIANILNLAPNTVNNWLKNGEVPIRAISVNALPPDIQAIVHLLAIHRDLSAMFSTTSLQQGWLATFNASLNAIPEELMSESIEGLIYVRNYLDDARERGF